MVAKSNNKVIFVLSVDTEEEFDWNGVFPQENCTVENIQLLPEFHKMCQGLGIRPTYLVDFPVANTPASAEVMKEIIAEKDCEIGAHLHPWCTPPIEGANTDQATHVVNLPRDVVERKLRSLMDSLKDRLNIKPTVFRTGRWGINQTAMEVLLDFGFKVDTSVYPYYENEYFSCTDADSEPYWPDVEYPNRPGQQRDIYELPVTAGFNRPDYPFWNRLHNGLSKPPFTYLKLVGFAWHSSIMKKLYMSPELANVEDMIALAETSIKNGNPVIHMFLHSSTLINSPSEYNQNNLSKSALFERIQNVVNHLIKHHDIEFATISEAFNKLSGVPKG